MTPIAWAVITPDGEILAFRTTRTKMLDEWAQNYGVEPTPLHGREALQHLLGALAEAHVALRVGSEFLHRRGMRHTGNSMHIAADRAEDVLRAYEVQP